MQNTKHNKIYWRNIVIDSVEDHKLIQEVHDESMKVNGDFWCLFFFI